MDLSSPLRSIAPGLDSAVLEVLARTESGLSATQITRLSQRGGRTGLLPVLNRLVEHGLVIADPANTGFMYRLNREHVLAQTVLTGAAARGEILDRLSAAVRQLRPLPVHGSLYGSFARGEAGVHSDLDLLLVIDDHVDAYEAAWTGQMLELSDRVKAWTGNRLETLTFPRSRLLEVVAHGESIVDSWISDSLTVHGPDIERLVATLRVAPPGRADRTAPRSGAGSKSRRTTTGIPKQVARE